VAESVSCSGNPIKRRDQRDKLAGPCKHTRSSRV